MKVILIGTKFFPGKKTASGYFFNFAPVRNRSVSTVMKS